MQSEIRVITQIVLAGLGSGSGRHGNPSSVSYVEQVTIEVVRYEQAGIRANFRFTRSFGRPLVVRSELRPLHLID
jgi:hypothetical protein